VWWNATDVKCLDPWGDSDSDTRDIVALYERHDAGTVWLRVDLMDLRSAGQGDLYIALDLATGGNTALVEGVAGFASDIAWDVLAVAYPSGSWKVLDASYADHPAHLAWVGVSLSLDYLEVGIKREALAGWDGSPFSLQCVLALPGSTASADRTAVARTDASVGRSKLVMTFGNMFAAYGPHAVSWYDGYALDPGTRPGERRGLRYLLDACELYGLPLTVMDLRPEVLPANDFLGIGARLKDMAARCLLEAVEVPTYGYAMPFQPSDVDARAIAIAREVRDAFGLPRSPVFHPYEGMATAGDLEAVRAAGYPAMYALDRYGYWFGWVDDWSCSTAVKARIEATRKVHRVDGLTVLFDSRLGSYGGIAWDARWGSMQWPPERDLYDGTDGGLHLWWRRVLADMAVDPDQERYFTIGTDLGLTPWLFGDSANRSLRWVAAHPWIEVTTLGDIVGRGWTPVEHGDLGIAPGSPMERFPMPDDLHYNAYFWQFYDGGVADGHSPLISAGEDIEPYADYVPYMRDGSRIPTGMRMGNATTPGTVVYETLSGLRTMPDNAIGDLAWLSYLRCVGEQALHSRTLYAGGQPAGDDIGGRYLHPTARLRANDMRQVGKLVAGARWAEGAAAGTMPSAARARAVDLDLDGENEYVLEDDRTMLIIENDGGRVEYAFAYDLSTGPVQLVGPVYQHPSWMDLGYSYEDGETAYRVTAKASPDAWDAAFQDRGREWALYDATIDGRNITLKSRDGAVTKVLSLDGAYLRARYAAVGPDDVEIGFGLPTSVGNMYMQGWAGRIAPAGGTVLAGWEVEGGGYSAVTIPGDESRSALAMSFLDSPAPQEGYERGTYPFFPPYPPGHWLSFPYCTVTLRAPPEAEVVVVLSTVRVADPLPPPPKDKFPPVAEAGPNQTIDQHAAATFDGTMSTDDIGITTWAWSFEYGGAPVVLDEVSPWFRFDLAGTYVVTLNVSDAAGKWATDSLTVTVRDTEPPRADAGPDIAVDQHQNASFDGTASTDNVRVVSWRWTFVIMVRMVVPGYGGPPIYEPHNITLLGPHATYMFGLAGRIPVTLVVADLAGNNDTVTLNVTVRDVEPPTAKAGPDLTVRGGTIVALDGSNSTDNVRVVSWNWSCDGGNLTASNGSAASVRFDKAGKYTVTLRVRDAAGLEGTDTLTVTATDRAARRSGEPVWAAALAVAAVALASVAISRRRAPR
jgi:PKD repeat protein